MSIDVEFKPIIHGLNDVKNNNFRFFYTYLFHHDFLTYNN